MYEELATMGVLAKYLKYPYNTPDVLSKIVKLNITMFCLVVSIWNSYIKTNVHDYMATIGSASGRPCQLQLKRIFHLPQTSPQ